MFLKTLYSHHSHAYAMCALKLAEKKVSREPTKRGLLLCFQSHKEC